MSNSFFNVYLIICYKKKKKKKKKITDERACVYEYHKSFDFIRLSEKFLSFYKEIIDAQCFFFILVYWIMHEHNNRNITKRIILNSIK